jgi:hypothetical protein
MEEVPVILFDDFEEKRSADVSNPQDSMDSPIPVGLWMTLIGLWLGIFRYVHGPFSWFFTWALKDAATRQMHDGLLGVDAYTKRDSFTNRGGGGRTLFFPAIHREYCLLHTPCKEKKPPRNTKRVYRVYFTVQYCSQSNDVDKILCVCVIINH